MAVIEFNNVTMYRAGIFGISVTVCKTLKLTTEVRYAQYTDAIRIEYLEKGKRSGRVGMLAESEPWLRIVDTAQAIQPADPLSPAEGGARRSRYSSCDPRYVTEFEDALSEQTVPIMFSVGKGRR